MSVATSYRLHHSKIVQIDHGWTTQEAKTHVRRPHIGSLNISLRINPNRQRSTHYETNGSFRPSKCSCTTAPPHAADFQATFLRKPSTATKLQNYRCLLLILHVYSCSIHDPSFFFCSTEAHKPIAIVTIYSHLLTPFIHTF